MINNCNSISYESAIWDLHIHSCACKKGSNEFSSLSIKEYINRICKIFSKFPDLKLISFTDHNVISADVYKEFISRKTNIAYVVGIEVDCFLNKESKDKKDFKHIIFYFDNLKFNLDVHADLINKRLGNSPILLDEFLRFLITDIKVPFLISPHFMKQGSRAIDFNWDEENAKKEIDKYIDQMCCFWETSNTSNIQHAISFLEEFDRGSKVSIISFSDSNCSSKLEEYLSNPNQYFNSLPTFNGLRLAGSDCRRIWFRKKIIDPMKNANYIGKISVNNNVIFLSEGLNSIVGGRGTGKSLLVDGIAYSLNKRKIENIFSDADERIDYLKSMAINVYDMNGTPLSEHDFKFDYYNQGYAQELFRKKSDLVSTEYFKDKFDNLKTYNIDEIKGEMLSQISFVESTNQNIENMSSLDAKIVQLSEEKNDLKFSSFSNNKAIEYPDYLSLDNHLTRAKIIPLELSNNKNIIKSKIEFEKTIYTEICLYNKNQSENNFEFYVSKAYKDLITALCSKKKEKRNSINLIKTAFKNSFSNINNRVSLLNSLLSLSSQNFNKEDLIEANGYEKRKFIFKRELKCESIFEYIHRTLCFYLDSNKLKEKGINDKNDVRQLKNLIYQFCYFGEEMVQDSKNICDLYQELKTLKTLKISVEDGIYIKDNEKIINLKNVSPGTRANYLLEYIVFSETGRPLIIDQLEDNIDNQTIYNQLTYWFNSLKIKRQVLVVTHDANIVVNSDSENVVICKQNADNIFDYKNGALEFDTILNEISVLLDGGKEAIERRLIKYGK